MQISLPDLLRLLKLVILVAVAGCSGSGTGGEQTVLFPDDSGSVDNSGGSGSDQGDSGPTTFVIEGPAETAALQAAFDNAKPGDTIVIRASNGVYRSDYRYPGETVRGFTLANSGTAENPIRIIGQGIPGISRPVFDQGKTAVHDPGLPGEAAEPTVGLFLLCASHLEIENLEIRNVHLAGITTSLRDCEAENIRISNSHIHHVYGERNVAAIRLSRASHVTIENNQIHDIFQLAGSQSETLVTGTNSGIHDIVIRHNDFSDIPVGVQLRGQNDKRLENLAVTHNRFGQVGTALAVRVDGADAGTLSTSAMSNLNFQDNLIVDSGHGIITRLDNSTQQSTQLQVFNNTVHELSEAFIEVSGVTNIAVYNNILSDIARDVLVTFPPQNQQLQTTFNEYDFNLYWSADYGAATGPEWLLDLGGGQPHLFDSLQAWQTAYSTTLHDSLSRDPDFASQFGDPQFVDQSAGDYQAQSAAAESGGRHGESIGAYRNGETPGLP